MKVKVANINDKLVPYSVNYKPRTAEERLLVLKAKMMGMLVSEFNVPPTDAMLLIETSCKNMDNISPECLHETFSIYLRVYLDKNRIKYKSTTSLKEVIKSTLVI